MANNHFYLENDNFMLESTGYNGDGKGDGIFRTSLAAMCLNSYKLLYECRRLLFIRRRWPKRLDSPDGIEHRNPWLMTRDPYVTFYAACMEMNRHEWIKCIKPPWYIWRPTFAAWRCYLQTGKTRHKKAYEFWATVTAFFEADSKPMFAVFLTALMAWTADSPKVMKLAAKKTPEWDGKNDWNLCVRQLVKHPDRLKDMDAIEAFQPRTGFMWQSDPRRTHDRNMLDNPKFLPPGQSFYMDRDVLDYFVRRNYEKAMAQ